MIIGAHDWTGQLAADGLVLPLFPSARPRGRSSPRYALGAFSYGTAVKRLYGAPVVLENIGLVVNTKLAKVPTTFAQLQAAALAFKKKESGNLAIAVPQGAARRRVPHVPVLLGPRRLRLRQEQGRQPRPVGHRRREQRRFLANATQIDSWNKAGPDQLEGRLRRRARTRS